jgi:hypothetical protein
LLRCALAAVIGSALCPSTATAVDVIRERSEATFYCDASNVAGSGNIMLFANVGGWANAVGGSIDPVIGGQLGIGGIMQFRAQGSFPAFSKVGLAQAHLQITAPGNDRLRPFGAALVGDLFLSTAMDTFSRTSTADKPEYSPYLRGSFLADIDWLAVYPWLPLKTYFNVGLADEPELLDRYFQMCGKIGLEWKLPQNSIFCDAGAGLYRENPRKFYAGDNRFEQYYVWLAPGGRYRFFNRFSVVGATRVLVFQHLKQTNPLHPDIFSAELHIEAPLFYRETNTETIRTLVFMEREKEKQKSVADAAKKSGKTGPEKGYMTDIDNAFKEFGDSTAASRENQADATAKKQREDIQKKLDDIEQMLKATE